MSLATPSFYREPPRRDWPRWLGAGVAVVLMHVGVVAYLMNRQPPSAPGVDVDAVEIDLSPPDAPAPLAPEVAPSPPQEEKAESVAAPPQTEPPPEPAPPTPEPPPPPEAVVPPPPEPPPPPPVEQPPVPETPVLPKPEAIIEPPKPDPAIEEQRVRLIELQKEQRRQAVREEQRREAVERQREAQREAKLQQQREARQRAAQEQKAQARREAQAQARAAASRQQSEQRASSSASLGDWKGQVSARVNAAKQDMAGAGSGATVVSFTVSAAGRVGGARVSSSSGSSALDQAAVSTIGRVGSVPPPPTGSAASITVRIRFGG